jgi:hypothetical protein
MRARPARFATAASRDANKRSGSLAARSSQNSPETSLGMSGSGLRSFISCIMALLLPLPPLVGADRGSAILHGEGGARLNGAERAGSTAVFAGASVETKPGFVANLDAEGSSVLIQTRVHGEIRRPFLEPRAGERVCRNLDVDERAPELYPGRSDYERGTQYDGRDINGTVQVAAHKNDVKIEQGSSLRKTSSRSAWAESATVHEGEQAQRDETQACGTGRPPEGPANGRNRKWLEIGGGAVLGSVVLCLLCTSKGQGTVRPTQP